MFSYKKKSVAVHNLTFEYNVLSKLIRFCHRKNLFTFYKASYDSTPAVNPEVLTAVF